jgi:hypothetical protein
MTNKKPKDIDEYKKWLKEKHKIEISDKTQKYYDSVASRIKLDLEKSDFWIQLTENLREYEGDYLAKTGYHLLTHGFELKLHKKTFDSFLLKTFRKNIIENKCWPDEPKDRWVLPNNWYSRINDIIRTLFEVKYLDGVEFMISKVKSICEEHSMGCKVSLEATEEGYYAAHLYIRKEFEIPKVTWDTEWIDVSIEIQITTQIQEVIRKLLHKYYEETRKRLEKEDIKWQWNYKSDEFVSNYLGHILHYVEGMIMEIREKQKEEII